MTKMKLCGLFRPCDIDAANELKPEYIGFVFAPKSRRYVTPEKAAELKKLLDPDIQAVGVFVNEVPERIAALLNKGIIDIAQLHGAEDENDINQLRTLTDKPIIKAFCIKESEDITDADLDAMGVKAVDDKTLEVTTTTRVSFFDELMSFPCFYPINEKFCEKQGDKYGKSAKTILGNGAFVMTNWEPGSVAEFEKNDKYYDAKTVKID